MQFLHLFLRSAGMKLLESWLFGVVRIAGMPDLFRSKNCVFGFLHEEDITRISARSSHIQFGMKPWGSSRRRFLDGYHHSLANNYGN